MNDRRSLIEGLKATPPTLDPKVEKSFVFGTSQPQEAEKPAPAPTPVSAVVSRSPFSTRIRTDLLQLLKRASLERQLNGVQPNSVQDIMEEALESWLNAQKKSD